MCIRHDITCCRNWDIAQLVPRDRVSPSETFDGFVKGMRVFTYALLFLLVLCSAMMATLCVLWLEAGMLHVRDTTTIMPHCVYQSNHIKSN